MAYTDYPFVELGDTPRKHAPIRRVEIVGYDGNKYATVRIGDKTLSVKAGYLHEDPELSRVVKFASLPQSGEIA